jgi:hypothetical protein
VEIKLFGKSVFEFGRSKPKGLDALVEASRKESKFLPDFHAMASGGANVGAWIFQQETLSNSSAFSSGAVQVVGVGTPNPDPKKDEAPAKPLPTPKEVFMLKTLNDGEYELKTDDAYVDAQLENFRDKLALVKSEEYDMRRGVTELDSIVTRLENRKKYAEHREFFEGFAYTTSSKIDALLAEQKHLQMGQVAQFVADMPKEATDAMKNYNAECQKLCGKLAVFYIIADKKDFQKSNKRRDPILLAQSPFAHSWQILGAWDEEMMFLEQL